MLNWVRSDLIKWSRDSIRHTGTSVGPGAFPRVQLPADPLDARVIASYLVVINFAADVMAGGNTDSVPARGLKQAITGA